MVRILQRLDRHPKAVDFLNSLEQDRIPVPPGLGEEIWSRYAGRLQRLFDELLKKGDEQGAWLSLWEKRREPEASENFGKLMKEFTQEQIDRAMKTLQRQVGDLCTKQMFPEALEAVSRTEKLVHPTKACATDDCNARLCNRRSTGASPLFGYFRSFKSPV